MMFYMYTVQHFPLLYGHAVTHLIGPWVNTVIIALTP